MNKVFCVSCGFKILYEASKPKFCSSCGKSVGGTVRAAVEESEERQERDIDINKLKKSISIENSFAKTSLKDLWSNPAPPSERGEFVRPASNDPEGQDLLDKTVTDCSSSRMKDVDE